MKYMVGDKVRVRSDLVVGKSYYMEDGYHHDSVMSDMLWFCGKEVTIKGYDYGKYRIVEYGFNWVDEMFDDNYSVFKKFLEELCLK